ncbi:MAG: DNA-binding response regulator [Candidatus Zixiibacteriota bacterium]|nr:MAG: DNA-binding response regulator [candidate division Zixibacteria bacterium]
MKKRILVVEDEEHIAEGLQINLEAAGYEVAIASDGNSALEMWRRESFDFIILDVMLPGRNGLEVCRIIRKESGWVPILFLTARESENDRIAGFQAGGDDYLTKPFNLQELLLRISAMFRRQVWYKTMSSSAKRYHFGNNWVDFDSYRAKGVSGEIDLTQKECMIMKLFSEHIDEVVDRNMILDAVWGYDAFPTSRTVDNFIVRLRKIFEPVPSKPKYFHSIRGVGYKFTPAG